MTKSLLTSFALAAAVAGFVAPAFAGPELDLAKKYNCTACHSQAKKMIGPAYKDVAAKYKGDAAAPAKLSEKVKKGGAGAWGAVPMPPNPNVPDADIKALVTWVLAGAN